MRTIIAAGDSHSLLLHADGTVRAWGYNAFGQLGNGDPAMADRNAPVQLPGLSGIVDIAAGGNVSLARTQKGYVLAWGSNTSYQLGRNIPGPQLTPERVPNVRHPTTLSAGRLHCLALYKDTAIGWGRNQYGSFGLGTNNDLIRPPIPLSHLESLRSIVCGAWGTSFAIRTRAPLLIACGRNDHGQLGDGTTTDRHTFVRVQGVTRVRAIAAGHEFAVALRSDGSVWAWGRNHVGQLGDGTFSGRPTPGPVKVRKKATAIAVGHHHALALDVDGRVWGWGFNVTAALGDGTGVNRNLPILVPGLSKIIAIAAGGSHSLAVDSNGHVWGWGYNVHGQIGVGSSANHVLTPTQLAGISVG